MDIELATNKELMDELFKRPTFAGLILFTMDEHKFDTQVHNSFGLMTSFSPKQACDVLLHVQDAMIKECHERDQDSRP
jgi:hypothetical protein